MSDERVEQADDNTYQGRLDGGSTKCCGLRTHRPSLGGAHASGCQLVASWARPLPAHRPRGRRPAGGPAGHRAARHAPAPTAGSPSAARACPSPALPSSALTTRGLAWSASPSSPRPGAAASWSPGPAWAPSMANRAWATGPRAASCWTPCGREGGPAAAGTGCAMSLGEPGGCVPRHLPTSQMPAMTATRQPPPPHPACCPLDPRQSRRGLCSLGGGRDLAPASPAHALDLTTLARRHRHGQQLLHWLRQGRRVTTPTTSSTTTGARPATPAH